MNPKKNVASNDLKFLQKISTSVLVFYMLSVILLWWIHRDPSNFSETAGFTTPGVFLGITIWALMWLITIIFTIVAAFILRVGIVSSVALVSAIGFACYVENSILAVISPAVTLSAVLVYSFWRQRSKNS